MNKPVDLSIIIPVYNVQDYLKQCMDSVICEDLLSRYEVILVDDGSTDSSGRICDSYAAVPGVSVFHKENGGLSDARNFGLSRASGRYIMFLDSDDRLCEDALSCVFEMLRLYDGTELITFNASVEKNGSTAVRKRCVTPGTSMPGRQFLYEELMSRRFYIPVWLYLYKKSFLDDNNLSFVKGLIHEDEEFVPRMLLHAESLVYADKTIYEYKVREDSIVTSSSMERRALALIRIAEFLEPHYDRQEPRLKKALKDYTCNHLLEFIRAAKLNTSEKRHLIPFPLLKRNCVTLRQYIHYYRLLLGRDIWL